MLNDQKRDLLLNVFYGDPPITSIKRIYDKVKQYGIPLKEIKEFTEKQEVNQMYRKIPRITKYFPITAKHINQIWQIDFLDLSDISTVNEKIKYHFVTNFHEHNIDNSRLFRENTKKNHFVTTRV